MKKSLILTGFLLVFIVPSAVSAASYRYYDDYYYNRSNRGSSYYDRYVSDRYLENERYWNNKYYSGSSRSTRTYKYIPVRENPRYTDRAYRTSPYTIHPDYRYNECDTGSYIERYYDGEKWVEYERRGNCDDRYRSNSRTIRCTVNCDMDYDSYNRYYY